MMLRYKNKKTYWITGLLGTIFLSFAGGWLFEKKLEPQISLPAPVDVRINSPEYHFINPLLFSKVSKDFYADEFASYTKNINDFIASSTKNGAADKISIYFRDLNTSHWTGINEDETYEPASMLKVVVMIACLRLSYTDPGFLSHTLYYAGPDESGQHYKPEHTLSVGNHTISELMNAMIIDSDNGATSALLSDSDINNAFQNVYSTFRLPSVSNADQTDYMSARSYSVIFRSLFNSTYLPWNLSEEALQLLSYSNFNDGIVAGVPAGTIVSHKFGEFTHTPATFSGNDELHDCGVVYYPNHPYLLCIMAAGENWDRLQKTLAGISNITYDFVKSSQE